MTCRLVPDRGPVVGNVRARGFAVVGAGQQVAEPGQQGGLEPADLRQPAGEDPVGIGVAGDLDVEVLDQRGEV